MTVGARDRETVKLSASLPAADVAYLERYATRHRLPSRSATLHAAVQALREHELEAQYCRGVSRVGGLRRGRGLGRGGC